MLPTPQLLRALQDMARKDALTDGEYRRVEKMGSYFLTRGDVETAKRDPNFTALFSLKIDDEIYTCCYRPSAE